MKGKHARVSYKNDSKAIKYILNSREDKGREIRPKSKINEVKMRQKKQKKMKLAFMNYGSEKHYISGCRRDRGKIKGDKKG